VKSFEAFGADFFGEVNLSYNLSFCTHS